MVCADDLTLDMILEEYKKYNIEIKKKCIKDSQPRTNLKNLPNTNQGRNLTSSLAIKRVSKH